MSALGGPTILEKSADLSLFSPQTFSSCTLNAGGAMDAGSGTFTAPLNGAYLFSVTVCSHDLKKVLVAVRRNGQEIASLYDQVVLGKTTELTWAGLTGVVLVVVAQAKFH